MREVGYALRRLRGSPAFSLAAIVTLAIAIGATASVFGIVDGVMLKAFPFQDPERVLTVWDSNPEEHLATYTVAPANFLDWRAQNTAFAGVAAAQTAQFTVSGTGEPERLWGLAVTPNYFNVLGVRPVLGRGLASDSAGPSEVVVGYDYWQARLGGTRSILGHSLTLDTPTWDGLTLNGTASKRRYTIVGVMPAGLIVVVAGAALEPQLWTRRSFTAADELERGIHPLIVYGRLKGGVTAEAAQHDMQLIAARVAQAYPQTNKGWSAVTIPLVDQLVGRVRPALLMLLAAATCVLLIGAANLANLFLVRCLAREREMAVRAALGATRGRLTRELVVEAGLLSLGAGALGVGLAAAGVRVLRALAPPTLPRLSQVGMNGQVVAFCAFTSIVTVFIFGALPAWHASRSNLAAFLKEGGRGTESAKRHRLQNGLVVLQVAVALILLAGAGLFVESFQHFERMDPGLRPDGVLTAQIDLSKESYPTPERQAAFIATVADRLAALPGVTAASASDGVPAGGGSLFAFTIVGTPAPDPGHMPLARTTAVTPNYFRTMGIRLLRGRILRSTDDARAIKVAVIDELMARRYFAGQEPLGQRLTFFGPDTAQIVGIVATAKQRGLANDDFPGIYMPFAQSPGGFAYVEVLTSGAPESETAALKQAIASVDPEVPVSDVQTLAQRLTRSVGTIRFSSVLASLFAGVALILGIVGVYSVLAYVVSQRQREIGIRLALGASHGQLVGDVLRQALLLAGTGVVLGAGTAWALTRALVRLLGGGNAYDPGFTSQGWLVVPTFVGAAIAFVIIALLAASLPAFRTTRVNPVVALTST
jgi:putative ABC transport system permease protein